MKLQKKDATFEVPVVNETVFPDRSAKRFKTFEQRTLAEMKPCIRQFASCLVSQLAVRFPLLPQEEVLLSLGTDPRFLGFKGCFSQPALSKALAAIGQESVVEQIVGYYVSKLEAEREKLRAEAQENAVTVSGASTTEKEQQSVGDVAENYDADQALADLQEEYSRLDIADSQFKATPAASSAGSNKTNARLRELTPEYICAEASKAADKDYLQFRLLGVDYFKKFPKKEDRSL